jgi:hypothetical protein
MAKFLLIWSHWSIPTNRKVAAAVVIIIPDFMSTVGLPKTFVFKNSDQIVSKSK